MFQLSDLIEFKFDISTFENKASVILSNFQIIYQNINFGLGKTLLQIIKKVK